MFRKKPASQVPLTLPEIFISVSTTQHADATQASCQQRIRRLDSALENVLAHFEAAKTKDGHWLGELSPSALSTATAISALSFYLEHPIAAGETSVIEQQIAHGFTWLLKQQNEDGGFGDTAMSYSNIATTMLVIAAIHAAKRTEEYEQLLKRAQTYVDAQGSIDGLRRRYGTDKTFAVPILANCAMAGIVPWKEVSALPFEAACVPQRFYHLMQMPVVSYAVPALVAIGQAKFFFDPPWDPIRKGIRKLAVGRSLRALEKMQPASGGFLEAVPLTSFVVMSLVKTGRADHPVARRGIRFLIDSFRIEQEVVSAQASSPDNKTQSPVDEEVGSWPIDTNLATWSTTLTINAFANEPKGFAKHIETNKSDWQSCFEWILSCQNQTVHPFTGSPPGGWGWTDLTGSVPDADDTPGALLALKNLLATGGFDHARQTVFRAAESGIDWLLKLQNRDRGWPTFCRGWGKFPFDRSGSDISAHAIRSLIAWESELAHFPNNLFKAEQVERAIANGFAYLKKTQHEDGSWLPLWFGNQDQPDDINPFYGTAKVLCAYRDADRIDTQQAQHGLNWLLENQNADGGWGGGPSINWKDNSLGHSSVEETALCTELLLSVEISSNSNAPKFQQAAQAGVDWLIRATEANCIDHCSPIGFYFAKLWYYEKSYPLIFAAAALSRAKHNFATDQKDDAFTVQ